jgi:OmpA-OmpF porin, OOP family
MMRFFLLVSFIAFSYQHSAAQVVQWASKVIEFSSELTPVQYSAQQALGKPNVLPAGGQSPSAWSPDMPKRKEFLTLGYANPISIRQIAIAESHNPSALTKVYAYDPAGKEYLINTLIPMVVPLKGRMLNIFMEPTPYKVAAIKLEFDGSELADYFGIDAVAISDSNYPIIADIPTMQLLASGILIESLDKNVNSEYKELNPVLSPDGKTLYFSRANHPENTGGVNDNEDIWYSQLDADGKWQLAKNLGPQFNTSEANTLNAIQAISPDGKSAIMLIGSKGDKGEGISISSNLKGEWSKPVLLKITNQYNLSDKANYFLSNNRLTMLMAVQRKDSRGDRDLYVSFMQPDSSWSEPLNLGPVVNTAAEESSPFLDTDNKTLYFSSKGFSGYGGSDIYVTRRLDESWTNWSDPENMGPAINSPLEDLFFNIPVSGEYAYYSRGLNENNTDIFRVKLPLLKTSERWVTVSGKVTEKNSYKPLAVKLTYERIQGGKETGITNSNPETGFYEIQFSPGGVYNVRAEAEGMRPETKRIDLKNVQANRVIKNHDFVMHPSKDIGASLPGLIYFELNKFSLTSGSAAELNKIAAMMKEQPSLEIEIAGHSDNLGDETQNLRLSEQRVKAVVAYLSQKGISAKRLHTAFHGSQKPLDSNDTEAGRGKNRRVEIKVFKL